MKKFKSFKPSTVKGAKKFVKKHWREWYSTSEWKRYRWRFLHHNPTCYMCGRKSEVVDHIRAHKGDVELFEMTNNHMPLCSICHNVITAKFDRLVTEHNAEEILTKKLQYIFNIRKRNIISVRVKVLPLYRR